MEDLKSLDDTLSQSSDEIPDSDDVKITDEVDDSIGDKTIHKVFIRHAMKQYRNGKAHRFSGDPGIVDGQENEIIETTQRYLDDYGKPDMIIVSPYYRCRQTAAIMNKMLGVPLSVDRRISEYLGNQPSQDVRPETALHKPPYPETISAFRKRVAEFYHDMAENPVYIWVVTHGLVMQTVYQLREGSASKPFGCLQAYLI